MSEDRGPRRPFFHRRPDLRLLGGGVVLVIGGVLWTVRGVMGPGLIASAIVLGAAFVIASFPIGRRVRRDVDAGERRAKRWKAARQREGLGPRHFRSPGWAVAVGVLLGAAGAVVLLVLGWEAPIGRRETPVGFFVVLLLACAVLLTALGSHDLLRDRRDRAAGRPTGLSPDGERFVELGDSTEEPSGATG